MTTKPTTDELLAKLAALDVEILYFGDDRKLQGAWLEEGAWVERVPWGDGEQRDIRRATDAEIIRALAAELLRVATDAAANANHTALGHAVAKVLAVSFDIRTTGGTKQATPHPDRPWWRNHSPDEQPDWRRDDGWRVMQNNFWWHVFLNDQQQGSPVPAPYVVECGRTTWLEQPAGRLLAEVDEKHPRHIPGPHEPDEDGVAECPNCTQSLTRGIRHMRKEDGTLTGMFLTGLFCSECDDNWEPAPAMPATPDEFPF